MLAGRADALALLALGTGLASTSPWLTGEPLTAASIPLVLGGGGWLGWQKAKNMLNRVNLNSREGFVIPSDDIYPETMGNGGLRLGYTKDKGLPVDVENDKFMRHLAIIGQSGVGKTTVGEYLLWQQMVRGGGWLFIDAKLDADTRDKLAYMAHLVGRPEDFYVLNVDDPHNSNTYNPILEGDADEIASRLLNLLPSSDDNPGADFYKQQSNYALTVLVAALKKAGYRYHFGDLSMLLQSARAIEEIERMIPPNSDERRILQIFLDQFRRRQGQDNVQVDVNKLKEVLGGMSGRIAMFAQGKFGTVFNTYTPEISLTDIMMNNKFLYVMLPTMGKDTAALNLGKMVLSDLRTAISKLQALPKYKRPNPPFLSFMDELGSYVMPGIARLFEQARSANVGLVPAFQSFANLSVVSPDFADMLIQNTWSKIFFKFGSKDSPETASEILGKSIKFQYSASVSISNSESLEALRTAPHGSEGDGEGVGESWRETEGFRVSPDQLRALGIGEAVSMIGPRVFHINTPMLNFPSKIPEYKVQRHKIKLPLDERELRLENRYQEFLLETQVNSERESKAANGAKENKKPNTKKPGQVSG